MNTVSVLVYCNIWSLHCKDIAGTIRYKRNLMNFCLVAATEADDLI